MASILGTQVFTTTFQSNIPEVLDDRARGLIRAARTVVGQRARTIKEAGRREIKRAGMGERLANTLRHFSRDIPSGIEANIFSKAKVHHAYKDATGKLRHEKWDLLVLFQSDEVYGPREKRYMAIPLPAAGGGPRGRKARVSDFPPGSLIAKIDGNSGVLVSRLRPDVPLFVLTRRVRRTRRLDFERLRQMAEQDLTSRILRAWARRNAHIALRLVA